jgi:hypothetical protein
MCSPELVCAAYKLCPDDFLVATENPRLHVQ